jgi:hypothetical protein
MDEKLLTTHFAELRMERALHKKYKMKLKKKPKTAGCYCTALYHL